MPIRSPEAFFIDMIGAESRFMHLQVPGKTSDVFPFDQRTRFAPPKMGWQPAKDLAAPDWPRTDWHYRWYLHLVGRLPLLMPDRLSNKVLGRWGLVKPGDHLRANEASTVPYAFLNTQRNATVSSCLGQVASLIGHTKLRRGNSARFFRPRIRKNPVLHFCLKR